MTLISVTLPNNEQGHWQLARLSLWAQDFSVYTMLGITHCTGSKVEPCPILPLNLMLSPDLQASLRFSYMQMSYTVN